MTTREEALAAAGRELALAGRELMERTPRESALAAYVPGRGLSVDELERRIAERVYGDRSAEVLERLGRSA